MAVIHQTKPLIIPVPNNKLIEEHFGGHNNFKAVSIARMEAPPGWAEPFQTPAFDEFTLVSQGKKQIIANGETLIVQAGESILIPKGTTVQYSNPFNEPCHYWSVCLPAFSMETVNREPE
jgi:mannose-6-phosphate isomerase-like protein (cupin superfamily)